MNKIPCNELSAWKALKKQAQSMNSKTIEIQLFNQKACGISLDLSHQQIDKKIFDLLIDLANERQVPEHIQALLHGDVVNPSENRPALHTALRAHNKQTLLVNGHDIMVDILATRNKMAAIATQIRDGQWLGFSGLPITSIVNIGIGGSDFGPRFCIDAFADLSAKHLNYHFVSDVDPKHFEHTVASLQRETTLFIISSKSFSTQETLYNARKALKWIGHSDRYNQHFIAVTAQVNKAEAFGINNVLPIWEWVGGRYSSCSAINLITCIALGPTYFEELLQGAASMDDHFQNATLHENLPVIMALMGIWNSNFLHNHSLLLMVYAHQLEKLVPFIQQLDMESNGKSIDIAGQRVDYTTGPIVWGGLGNQAQHSFYQLLCQGTHKIAADFISTQQFDDEIINTLCNAKIRVLSQGIAEQDSNAFIAGGMPINHIRLISCSPHTIGALIALYEHKIFVQSVIWNINPFDQPGVESAKRFHVNKPKETAETIGNYGA